MNLERTWSNRSPPNSIPVLSQTPAAAPGGSQAAGQVMGGCRYSLPLASNMGPRYPDAGSKTQTHFSLHCSHKGSGRVTQPKLSPWEGSLVSKQWTRETGRWGLCRRGAEQGSQAGTGLPALWLSSALRQHSQLRPGCHGTVRLVTHSGLWPEPKRQMKARKGKRGTGESSTFPGVRQE